MTRAISTLRRLRTIEYRKLQELALCAASSYREPPPTLTAIETRRGLELAEAYFEKVSQLNEEIVDHPDLSVEDAETEATNYGEHRSVGLQCLADFRASLANLTPDSSAVPLQQDHVQRLSDEGTDRQSSASEVAVVKVDVSPEPFDGDRLRYRSFVAQFKNWIDHKANLSSIDKLIVLRKHLRGEAKTLIDSLQIDGPNYQIALDLLQQAFGQVNIERQQVMAALFNLHRVGSSADLTGLRTLLNTVQAGIQRMEALGAPLSEYALALEPALHSSVPSALIFDYTEASSKALPGSSSRAPSSESAESSTSSLASQAADGITGFVDYLRRFVGLREQTGLILQRHRTSGERDRDPPRPGSRRPNRPPGSSRRFDSTVSAVGVRNQGRACFFCKKTGHKPSVCPVDIGLEQKLEILDKMKRCRHCFRFRHDGSVRCTGPREKCSKCDSPDHYSAMHSAETRATSSAVTALAPSGESIPSVLLHTASATVVSGSRRIPIRLFLDSGSSITFLSPRLIRDLPELAPVSSARLGLTTFSTHQSLTANRYTITLQNMHDSSRVDISGYEYDFRVDPSPECSVRDRQMIERFAASHSLADACLLNPSDRLPVSVLVGRDQFFRIARVGMEKTLDGELVARGSILGWIIGGASQPTRDPRPDLIRAQVHCCVASISRSARELEKLWRLEAIGIEDNEPSPLSADELEAVRQLKESLHFNDQQYTVQMPRRPGIESLPCNFGRALDRMTRRVSSLRGRPEVYARYHQEVMAFVDQNHAELVGSFSPNTDERPVEFLREGYFMPHHNVVTTSEQGEKWCIVFDCSSAAKAYPSLNFFLLPGPNLNPDIVNLLLNFRIHRIAISADITKAYLCINIVKSDRRLFRFLWQGPGDREIRCYQMKKVTWGATPSGFVLAFVLREHFARVDPDSTLKLGDSFYHDDFLRSFPSVSEAKQFTDFVRTHLSSAGMKLAKWKTNSDDLAEHLVNNGVKEAAFNLEAGKLLKVLGIAWRPAEDTFQFALEHLIQRTQQANPPTKRSTLRLVASIYDPLGWLAPFLVRGKLILRALWAADLNWDDPLDDNLTSRTGTWTDEIPDLSPIRIPRCIVSDSHQVTSRHLHIFADASPLAYATVAYIQTFFSDGSSTTSIVMSKSRVSPRQPLSLPRLELMAAVLAVRLLGYLVRALAVTADRISLYTDSMVAYHWCTSRSPSKWKTFVANRIAEIQGGSSPDQWFHVPGSQNVADLATRGISARDLHLERRWWDGPDWLKLPESERPASQPGQASTPLEPAESEMRPAAAIVAAAICAQRPSVIDVDRFGTLGKAVRVTENVFAAIRRLRRTPVSTAVHARREALNYLIRGTQQTHFSDELAATIAGDVPQRRSSPSLTEDEKSPIVLPGESRLAYLIIVNEHRVNAHLGVSTILASIRRRYWITRGRQRIKSILSRCVNCKKQHGPSVKVQEAPLPVSRLSPVVPFQTAGVDFCGPFLTRSGSTTEKCYIALFTCTVVRAVHLELVPSMTTVHTHLAVRRFLSLFPECTRLVSDNGRSFVKAAADIKRLFNSVKSPELKSALTEHGLEWSFQCPRAPSWNGFIERMVGTVKSSLKRTLGKSLLSFEELRTIIAELAAAVNDRPLTYSSGDPDDVTPITPAHFLRGAPRRSPLCTLIPLDELEQKRLRSEMLNRTTYYRSLEA